MPTQSNNGVRRRWTVITGCVAILGIVLSISAWAFADRMSVGNRVKENAMQVEVHSKSLEDHEGRVRQVEKVLPAMATDVEWIRKTMEKSRGE